MPEGHEGLRGLDAGEWAGRTLDEVAAADPAGVHAWLTDPGYAPPGGESTVALIARVGAELAALPPARTGSPWNRPSYGRRWCTRWSCRRRPSGGSTYARSR
ncbi:histidine phosphatase family protein [Streptomyces nojiriensis]